MAPANVGLVTLPRLALFPGDGVAGCAVLQAGPVREVCESWSVGLPCFAGGCLFFLGSDGRPQWGSHVEEDRLFAAAPASEVGLGTVHGVERDLEEKGRGVSGSWLFSRCLPNIILEMAPRGSRR